MLQSKFYWLACAVLLLKTAHVGAQSIPSVFQGDWINVADQKQRLKDCQELKEYGYTPLPNIYALTLTENSVEHRYIDDTGNHIFLNDIDLKFHEHSESRITGVMKQEYAEGGADMDFPLKKGLPFQYTLSFDQQILRSPNLSLKNFYRC